MKIPLGFASLPKKNIILTFSILTGATPLIPIPFLDDYILIFLQRQMVYNLAKSHGFVLPKQEINRLSNTQKFGCSNLFFYMTTRPFRKILRKFLMAREIGRGIELATHTYYYGFLLDEVFHDKLYDSEKGQLIFAAIQTVIAKTNTKLVKGIIDKSFRLSQGIIKKVSQKLVELGKYALKKSVRYLLDRLQILFKPTRIFSDSFDLDRFFEINQPDFSVLIKGLVGHLNSEFGSIPMAHFEEIRTKLFIILREGGIEPHSHCCSDGNAYDSRVV